MRCTRKGGLWCIDRLTRWRNLDILDYRMLRDRTEYMRYISSFEFSGAVS